MPTSRARRNKRKFARLHAMTGHRSWRRSAPGDSGLALWNKHAVDCVYEFVVREVNRTSLLVRFVDEDEDFEVMPAKMPVVTAGDGGLMERLREECRLMWSELFSDASGDGGDEEDSEGSGVETGDGSGVGVSSGDEGSAVCDDSDDSDDKPLLAFEAVHCAASKRADAKRRLRLCRVFVDAGESDGSGSEFSSEGL